MTCLKHYVRVNRTEEKSFETRKTACINKGLRLKYKQLGKKAKSLEQLGLYNDGSEHKSKWRIQLKLKCIQLGVNN